MPRPDSSPKSLGDGAATEIPEGGDFSLVRQGSLNHSPTKPILGQWPRTNSRPVRHEAHRRDGEAAYLLRLSPSHSQMRGLVQGER